MQKTVESLNDASDFSFVEPPRKKRTLKRLSTFLAVLIVLLAGGYLIFKPFSNRGSKDANQYMVAAATVDTVKKTVTATGVLKPWTVVDIKSKAGGRIDLLAVTEGSKVRKGQLIAKIDPSDTLLTFSQAKADIESNHARIDETRKTLNLQESQTDVAVMTAQAGLGSAKASAQAALARYRSAKSQSDAQARLSAADLETARATLAAEKARLNQMMSATHPQESATANAALDQGKANLKNAEAQLNRERQLWEKGYVARAEVDQAQATFDVAQANLGSAQAKINTIQPELESDLNAERARVDQSTAAFRTAEANQVQIALKKQAAASAWADYQQSLAGVRQADAKVVEARAGHLNNGIRQTQIEQAQASGARAKASLINAQTQLEQTKVTAPSDGIVLQKYVEQGTIITSGVSFNSTGTSIIQMGDVSRMYVDVQVDETDVASVDLGQDVDITFDAYPTTPFEGKVIKIDPQAVVDQNVTTVHVRVEVDNSVPSFRLLKPSMNATCEFVVGKQESVLSIPSEALKADDQGNNYVEVAQGGKTAPAEPGSTPDPALLVDVKAIRRPVTVGLEGNDTTEIKSGLKEGERVVTQTIEPSTATPTGGNPFGGGQRGPGRR